ncbi:MAG: hypothetical protein IIY52_03280 [Solobacterium sp.]|nr:hypothetical protein [Erysipelotrichaceae bacterium]MBQ1325019.1 hypothetical protein [Solobacterium sp.]MBQ1383225.1 hypothetical protein [Solobacterium sp.]MBQ1445672.1 hypothetical protein [Solobacterium sp.]MBQ2690253.1 hypothetical protein [Solobacterium sp.]
MTGHAFTTRKYIGKNIIGKPAVVYELLDNGAVVYTLTCGLKENGEEYPEAEKSFWEKADIVMDRIEAAGKNVN